MKFRIGQRVKQKGKNRHGSIEGFAIASIEPWGEKDQAPAAWVRWDDWQKHAVIALLEDLEEDSPCP